MSRYGKPTLRPAERQAFCRACDKTIQKGEEMISWYSRRGQGMHIHLHTSCAREIGYLAGPPKQEPWADQEMVSPQGIGFPMKMV